ncbi:MAG: ketopantoate reductase family protein [Spirochaeta sp.]|jgi:2-dehydropantoate 2-reductase|nr:ketopantoate reductase family protein [Spirochaeta sp.]
MEHTADDTVVLGAGALGAMYAHQISRAGLPVSFFAAGERAERLTRDGVIVNGTTYHIPVTDHALEQPPARVIVALKDQHLAPATEGFADVCGPDTTVLSVMNGIDSEYQLAAALGESITPDYSGRVLHCMVAGMDAVRDGNDVRFTQMGTVSFGRRRNDPARPDARVSDAAAFFAKAGIPAKTPEDMETAIWNKFMLNVGINQWSAVFGATYSLFHTDTHAQNLMRRAMREVLAIAQAKSIDLTEDDLEHWFSVVNTLSPDGKTSMAQDVEAGRPTEVHMFAGRVVEMGREVGVATPVNEVLLDAIQAVGAVHPHGYGH